jgi:hypothetical protein
MMRAALALLDGIGMTWGIWNRAVNRCQALLASHSCTLISLLNVPAS